MFDAVRLDRKHFEDVLRVMSLLHFSQRRGPVYVKTGRVNERNGAPIFEQLVNRGSGAGTERAIEREAAAERARQAQSVRLQMQEAA